MNPLIAVLLGTVLLSEPFSLRLVLAAALVFAGIVVVRSAPRIEMRGTAAGAREKAVA